MSTINPTVKYVGPDNSILLVTWALVATGDVGAPVRPDWFKDLSFEVYGTTITALALNGSNDIDAPTNYQPLRDWTGGSLGALAAAGFYSPRDMPIWVSPVLTTGAAVTVAMAAHRRM